ncbi:unnamed protein product [Prunus brigantina]
MNHLCSYNYHNELQKPQHLAGKTKATKGKSEGPLYKAAGRFQHMGNEQVSSKRHPRDQGILASNLLREESPFEPACIPILLPSSDLTMEEGRKENKEMVGNRGSCRKEH